MSEEILDLVDTDDNVIGQLARTEVYARDLHSYRVVNCFLRNSHGQLWIPRRAASKKLKAGALEYSVAGHVSTGETYDQALLREAAEEIHFDLMRIPWRRLGKLTPPADGSFCFQGIYEIQSDETPAFNPEDHSEAKWMSVPEILAAIAAGEPVTYDFELTIRRFFMSSSDALQ